MKHRVLVVDDDPGVSRAVRLLLEDDGHETVVADTVRAAKEQIGRAGLDLVVTDLKLPDGDGLEVLRRAKEAMPDVPVIMITAHASIPNAVEAMKLGAFDYLTKPFENERLKTLVANALKLRDFAGENARLRKEMEEQFGLAAIAGSSTAMERVRELTRLAATSDAAVLILGETGTGKELVARAIYLLSNRSSRPFVPVNCGAIPETLVESELFGHRKGSFTGATSDREGRFVQADTGTIFLDEVTEMRRDSQVKLLRALEAHEVQPVGSTEAVKVDVRVASATNQNPEECVRAGTFREDLYYRLNVFTVKIPPLREHREDIPEIAARFLGRRGYGPDAVSKEAMQLLAEHDFPGNVRELQNVLEFGLILSQGKTINPEHIAERLMPRLSGSDLSDRSDSPDFAPLTEVERSHLEAALKKTGGNQSQAARLLRISRATLIYRMKKHGLDSRPSGSDPDFYRGDRELGAGA